MSQTRGTRSQGTSRSTSCKPVLIMFTNDTHASTGTPKTVPDTEATNYSSTTTSTFSRQRSDALKPSLTAVSSSKTPSLAPFSAPMSTMREVGFMFIISMLQVVLMAQMSSVLPTSQIIAQSFDISDKGLLPWTLAAYSLIFSTFTLVSGRLSDIFGHKNMIVIGFD